MIFLLREKDFLRNKKKLVEPKDYMIFDATDDATGELAKFTNCVSVAGLKMPKTLIKLAQKLKDDRDFDFDSINITEVEKREKKFFKTIDFLKAVDQIFAFQHHVDHNVFVVFANSDFKAYEDRIVKRFRKIAGDASDIIFTMDDIDDSSKILRKGLSYSDISALKDSMTKIEKQIREYDDEKNDRSAKKKSKKDKDKKKKKKKKSKKDRWMDFDI